MAEDLDDADSGVNEPPVQTNQPDNAKNFCKFCGVSLLPDAVFCEACGKKLNNI